VKKLSIITINLNNVIGLRKTINSVLSQNYTNYEYIIIDGGSFDGSRELIEHNSTRINFWVSERDNGIYNAMNKGISFASGEYIQFLNSGDVFFNNDSLFNLFANNFDADIVYTDFEDLSSHKLYKMPANLTFRFFYKQSLNHQATIIKRYLFQKNGGYNEETPIIADWEFFTKSIVLNNSTTEYIPLTFISSDTENSVSHDQKNFTIIQHYRKTILERDFPLLKRDMEYFDQLENSTTYKLLRLITKFKSFFIK